MWWAYLLQATRTFHLHRIHRMEMPARLTRSLLHMSAAHMHMTRSSHMAHCRARSTDHSSSSLHTPTPFPPPLHRPPLRPSPNPARPHLRPSQVCSPVCQEDRCRTCGSEWRPVRET